MLILVAKGYTVTRGKLRKTGWIKIVAFTTIYVITYMILFLIEAEVGFVIIVFLWSVQMS